jgi:hypothetical protein
MVRFSFVIPAQAEMTTVKKSRDEFIDAIALPAQHPRHKNRS